MPQSGFIDDSPDFASVRSVFFKGGWSVPVPTLTVKFNVFHIFMSIGLLLGGHLISKGRFSPELDVF